MNYPKVLVCVVTASSKSYCEKDFFKQIKSFTYPNYDILICDNSSEHHYYNKLKEIEGFDVIRVNPEDKSITQFLAESYEKLRLYALDKKYDFILCNESDVFTDN